MSERRLLICDDEPAFERFDRTVAESMGYRVPVMGPGPAYDDFQPTTVVLDTIVPAIDGQRARPLVGAAREPGADDHQHHRVHPRFLEQRRRRS